MSVLYLDIFSGISGDMFLGALLDLGIDSDALERELSKLGVEGYHLHTRRGEKQGITGTKFDVHLAHAHSEEHDQSHWHRHHGHEHPHDHEDAHSHEHGNHHEHEHAHSHTSGENRTFADIRGLLLGSALSDWVKSRAIACFQRIAVAEGKIHGKPPDQVHFHEVGAVDSIVDIAGACIALDMLGRPRVLASAVVEGTGFVKCAHGLFPVPTPATLAILAERKAPISQCEEPNELVTPTGAALLAEFVERFGPMQNLTIQKIGIGLGARDNKSRPNILRALLAEERTASSGCDWETDTVAVVETNIDDLNPEVLGAFMEQAFAQGALDVYHTPVQMKKNRPGVVLTILCAAEDADHFSEMVLTQTSAFGVRRTTAERRKLRREFREVQTLFGEVSIKLGLLNGKVVQASPEFESCRKVAEQRGLSVKDVYAAGISAANSMLHGQ